MANEKVLLVDDEQDFVEALTERLKNRGLDVESTDNGNSAIEKVKDTKFDVIILDMAMPGIDGIETLSKIKEDSPDIQVILLTGHATVEKSVEAIKLGAMDFLEKPVDIKVLFEKIKEAKEKSDEKEEQKSIDIVNDILKSKGW